MTGATRTQDLDSEIDCLRLLQTEHTPFLHPAWLRTWFDEFGEHRQPVFVRAGDEDSVGIAALMRDGDTLTFLGDSSVCDFMDVLVDPSCREAAYQGLWDQICREEWSELVLWGLMDCSLTREAITALARAAGYGVSEVEEAVAPRLTLPATWEDYLLTLGKKDRHELRRKMRRLMDNSGAKVELRVVSEPADVGAGMDDFLRLHTVSRADKMEFMQGRMPMFFRRMASALAGAGLLRLFLLDVDGKAAAAVLCFDAGSYLYMYNSGYDPDFAGLSVGLVSKALCLRWAIENGKTGIDFLRGDEPYKYDLGAVDQKIYTLTVRR